MKRTTGSLPHIVVSVYIALLSSTHPRLFFLRFGTLGALLLIALNEKRTEGASPVIKAYMLYLAVNLVGFWFFPGISGHTLVTVPGSLMYAALLAVAVVPPLFGGPRFTDYFAKKTTPAAVWETEPFKEINRNMSWVWAGLFAASLVVTLVPGLLSLQGGASTALVFQIALPGALLLGLGVRFNKWYPGHYQRRLGIEPVQPSRQAGEDRPDAALAKIEKEKNMSSRYRVVAVNGSPHAAGSNTSIMIQMMAPVLAAEGIDLEEIFLAEKHIEFCVGCGVCTEKGRCWRHDDHGHIIDKVLAADALILASPVYFGHVTAQMKAFIDRSLAYGHKPRSTWKPGLAVSVSAGMAETTTATYLAGELRPYGAFAIGQLTAIAVSPGGFLGKELVEARAADLARDLARAIKEKRRYPATERDLLYYLFIGDLVRREKAFMKDDFRHWQESGFYEGFESYVGQTFTHPPYDEEMRKKWIGEMVAREKAGTRSGPAGETASAAGATPSFTSCRELLEAMPLGFKKEAAAGIKAVYQFEITGTEEFKAYLTIDNGTCTYAEGAATKPDVTIKSPAEVWLAISRGEMNGQTAFMAGRYTVEGDFGLLMKLGKLFGSST